MSGEDTHSSISDELLSMILDKKVSSEEILEGIVEDGIERSGPPEIQLSFYVLTFGDTDPDKRIMAAKKVKKLKQVNQLSAVEEEKTQFRSAFYKPIERKYFLRDLSRYGLVDAVRIGRNQHCDFNPYYIGEDTGERKVDEYVSREHGLVVSRGSKVYYIDFGTLIKEEDEDKRGPGRHGSKNGTYVNNKVIIKKLAFEWGKGINLNFGEVFTTFDDIFATKRRRVVLRFQMNYQPL